MLLPATVFMLCPTSAHPDDERPAGKALRAGSAIPTDTKAERKLHQAQAIENVTRAWHDTEGAKLSAYFRDRFGPRRGGLLAGDVRPPAIRSSRQDFAISRCAKPRLIVGALYEINSAARTQS